MATYKEIKGVTIQTLDADPVQNVGTWASIANANTTHEECGSAGTACCSWSQGESREQPAQAPPSPLAPCAPPPTRPSRG